MFSEIFVSRLNKHLNFGKAKYDIPLPSLLRQVVFLDEYDLNAFCNYSNCV